MIPPLPTEGELAQLHQWIQNFANEARISNYDIERLHATSTLITRLWEAHKALGLSAMTDRVVAESKLEKAEAKLKEAREIIEAYRDAVIISATMEGPRFHGYNASALKRAWGKAKVWLSQQDTEEK